MGIGQYLKETQGELRHVAWPTRSQTVIYTVLVALISIGISLYLGFFDFLFTTGLARVVGVLPAPAPAAQTEVATTSSSDGTPGFTITPVTDQKTQ